jgi:hypothetical protein
MENDYKEKQRKSYNLMRTVYNITMGLIIIGIGLVMLFHNKIGLNLFEQFDPIMIYGFGGLCILYGGFRLYRGIKKDY